MQSPGTYMCFRVLAYNNIRPTICTHFSSLSCMLLVSPCSDHSSTTARQQIGPKNISFFTRALSLRVCVFNVKSSSSVSCDRSIASSKLSSPKSAIQSFLLQLPVSSCFLQVIQQLLTSPSSPSRAANSSFINVT
jgi:hypothetical protein